ncbi:MAG: hypothetical protein ABIA21_04045 [Candidatus Aenigmatarchaeota archaeon]
MIYKPRKADIISVEKVEPFPKRVKGLLYTFWDAYLDSILSPYDKQVIVSHDLRGNCGIVRQVDGGVEMTFTTKPSDKYWNRDFSGLCTIQNPDVEELLGGGLIRGTEQRFGGFENIADHYYLSGFIFITERPLIPDTAGILKRLGYDLHFFNGQVAVARTMLGRDTEEVAC